ncbi:Squamous cell carcinoma antigen recognized by T-cells 3 [Mortierella sp. GBA43]|nr:Squamous cell carcinoma antigen recognized by T-cells 3 [Mortierella sp. GBA43]
MSSTDGASDDDRDLETEAIDMDEDQISPITLEAIATLRGSLEANPIQYELHTQLIALLKDAAMLEELRRAREAMSAAFPLTEELWTEWIEDESNMAASEDEKKHVLSLYERATSDYLSINIWKSYVDYAIQEYTESAEYPDNDRVVDIASLRSIFRKADKATGYHFSQGHVVWDAQRDFELQWLSVKDPVMPDDVNRVKTMFMERIAIPHATLEDTFSSLSSFTSKYDGDNYEETMVKYNKIASTTRTQLSKLEPFEEQLVSTSNSLDAFNRYLEFELHYNRGQLLRITTLFERALAIHCLVPGLWNDFVTFLMTTNLQKKSRGLEPSDVLNIAKRSVRNCPWSGDLWENRIVLLDMYEKPLEEFDGELNRTRGEGTFIRELSLIWRLNNISGARKVFVRACSVATTLDWPERVLDAWLKFEQETGDLITYKDALARTRAAMKSVEALRAQAAQVETGHMDSATYQSEQLAPDADPGITESSEPVPSTTSTKRKLDLQDEEQDRAPKVSKVDNEQDKHTTEAKVATKKQTTPSKPKAPLDISHGRHEDTCFVANFPDDMTEKRLKELFQEEEAHAALALDGRDVGQRRGLSVKISDTSRKTRGTTGPPMPTVSRHEVHISGISNELKEDELSKLMSLKDADAALALNGTSFHGKELSVQRRRFQNHAKEGDGQNLSRKERRKFLAIQREQEAQGGDRDVVQGDSDGAHPVGEANEQKVASTKFGEKGVARANVEVLQSASDRPQVMPPPRFAPLSRRPARALVPRAIKKSVAPDTTSTTATTSSTRSADAKESGESSTKESTTTQAAPKSNADFRQMVLAKQLQAAKMKEQSE